MKNLRLLACVMHAHLCRLRAIRCSVPLRQPPRIHEAAAVATAMFGEVEGGGEELTYMLYHFARTTLECKVCM